MAENDGLSSIVEEEVKKPKRRGILGRIARGAAIVTLSGALLFTTLGCPTPGPDPPVQVDDPPTLEMRPGAVNGPSGEYYYKDNGDNFSIYLFGQDDNGVNRYEILNPANLQFEEIFTGMNLDFGSGDTATVQYDGGNFYLDVSINSSGDIRDLNFDGKVFDDIDQVGIDAMTINVVPGVVDDPPTLELRHGAYTGPSDPAFTHWNGDVFAVYVVTSDDNGVSAIELFHDGAWKIFTIDQSYMFGNDEIIARYAIGDGEYFDVNVFNSGADRNFIIRSRAKDSIGQYSAEDTMQIDVLEQIILMTLNPGDTVQHNMDANPEISADDDSQEDYDEVRYYLDTSLEKITTPGGFYDLDVNWVGDKTLFMKLYKNTNYVGEHSIVVHALNTPPVHPEADGEPDSTTVDAGDWVTINSVRYDDNNDLLDENNVTVNSSTISQGDIYISLISGYWKIQVDTSGLASQPHYLEIQADDGYDLSTIENYTININ